MKTIPKITAGVMSARNRRLAGAMSCGTPTTGSHYLTDELPYSGQFSKWHERADGRVFFTRTIKSEAGWTAIAFDAVSGAISWELVPGHGAAHVREAAAKSLVERMA